MKEHYDGVCILCGKPKDLGDIMCYIGRGAFITRVYATSALTS